MTTVSIIISNYNKIGYIRETIDSVLNQTYTNWELIIIDDNSTDNSLQIISEYLHNNQISLIKNQENKGANYCRNIGLKNAKGEYLVFLDSDDILISTCLENRIATATENTDANLLVFAMGVFYKKIGDDKRNWLPISKNPLQDFLQHKLAWSILQPLWKRNFLLALGGFNEAFERLQDVELHTRALLSTNINYKLFPEIMDCYYRIDEERKIFNPFQFLSKWTNSAVMYCNQFEKVISFSDKKYLYGTLLKTYQQLIFQLKNKAISQYEFLLLQEKLFSTSIYSYASPFKKKLLEISFKYNSLKIRIPGINWVLFKLTVS